MTREEKQSIANWFIIYCKRNYIKKPTKNLVDDFIKTYKIDIDSDYLMKVKLN